MDEMSDDCCLPARGRPLQENCCDETKVAQLKALGHPVRMQIVRQLLDGDRRCCGDLCSCLPLAQSTISQHLDLLCKAGLVRYEAQGTRSLYSLDSQAFAALAAAIGRLASESGAQRDGVAGGKLP
jgi:ArsR family transcriptional regulator, arsenate/arsenite/antimonite-responsive transcriptional repressor